MRNKTVEFAIKDFLFKNFLTESQISVIDVGEMIVIIRVFDDKWDVIKNRSAEKTIYHGVCEDIFSWKCLSRTSGILRFDGTLTDEYKCKYE